MKGPSWISHLSSASRKHDSEIIQRERARLEECLKNPKWKKLYQDLEKLKSDPSLGIEQLAPWKKGPYQIENHFIDSEWDCSQKWDRMQITPSDLQGKSILDVGCNNGYFLFEAQNYGPQFSLGIDPTFVFKLQFDWLHSFLNPTSVYYSLLGALDLELMPQSFDVIFYMGILYHHSDPIKHLKLIKQSLKPGGKAYIETIGIPGEEDVCLFPKGRYAGMGNVYFFPTLSALKNMLERAKFSNIEVLSRDWGGVNEQRSTAFSGPRSYSDQLDPKKPGQTLEGYPAPERFMIKVDR